MAKGKKKEIELVRGDFKTVTRRGAEKGGLDVDVYYKGKLVLEWSYAFLGHSLDYNALMWRDQAILQAHAEMEKDAKLPPDQKVS